MIIYIKKEKILEEITKVSRIISQKSLVPALHGILIEVKKDSVILTASDGDLSIKSEIKSSNDLIIKSIGNILIKGKYLIDILKKVDDEFVTLEALESTSLRIKASKFDSSISTLNVLDYPNIVFNLEGKEIKFSNQELKEIILQTSFAIGFNEKRIVFNGLNLKTDKNNKQLVITATDSFRLACKIIPYYNETEFDIIIPGKFIIEIGKLLTEEITLKINEKFVSVILNNLIIQSKIIEGKYPDTSKVIPLENNTVLTVDNREIIKIIERASVLSNDFMATIITLKLKNQRAVISSLTQEIGNTEEEVNNFVYSGEDQVISFNSRFMLDALKAFSTKKVSIKLINEVKPIIIVSDEQLDLQQLVLPIRSY